MRAYHLDKFQSIGHLHFILRQSLSAARTEKILRDVAPAFDEQNGCRLCAILRTGLEEEVRKPAPNTRRSRRFGPKEVTAVCESFGCTKEQARGYLSATDGNVEKAVKKFGKNHGDDNDADRK